MHDIYIAFTSFSPSFADTCTHSVPIFLSNLNFKYVIPTFCASVTVKNCFKKLRHEKNQKHLRLTIDGPHSSYSCFEIHILSKVEREANIEPPIQAEYFLSGGAITLIFAVGAK